MEITNLHHPSSPCPGLSSWFFLTILSSTEECTARRNEALQQHRQVQGSILSITKDLHSKGVDKEHHRPQRDLHSRNSTLAADGGWDHRRREGAKD